MIGKQSNELVFSEAYAFHEYVLYSEHMVLHNTLKHSLMPLALWGQDHNQVINYSKAQVDMCT